MKITLCYCPFILRSAYRGARSRTCLHLPLHTQRWGVIFNAVFSIHQEKKKYIYIYRYIPLCKPCYQAANYTLGYEINK